MIDHGPYERSAGLTPPDEHDPAVNCEARLLAADSTRRTCHMPRGHQGDHRDGNYAWPGAIAGPSWTLAPLQGPPVYTRRREEAWGDIFAQSAGEDDEGFAEASALQAGIRWHEAD